MRITPISQNEINQSKVASLPARPNASTAFGGAGYSSAQLKEAFDRLPLLAIGKLNELLSALSKAPGEGSLADEISTAKTDNEGKPYTLSELFSHIIDGTLATYLLVGEKPLDVAISEITPLQSPAFTGEPTAPTPSAENESDRIATTAFVYCVLRQALDKGNADQIETVTGESLRFFVGTQNEYEALENKNGLFAIITDDQTKNQLFERLEALENDLQGTKEALFNGIFQVQNAKEADVAYAAYVAERAYNADSADYTENANRAQYATLAETADRAMRADEADTAVEAHTAFVAEKSETTDLTNAQWTAFDMTAFTFELGKSYQVCFKYSFYNAWILSEFTVLAGDGAEQCLPSTFFGRTSFLTPYLSSDKKFTGIVIKDDQTKVFSQECSDFKYREIK